MQAAQIITIITSVIHGIAKVSKFTREILAKSLEEMAADVRAGGLIPDDLLHKVKEDSEKLDKIRNGLPD